MTVSAAPLPLDPRPRPIASAAHTAVLVAILLAIALRGAAFQAQGGAGATPPLAPLYASVLASEWLLVYAVWRGVRRTGTTLGDLVGGRWSSVRDVARDAALALACWGLVLLLARAWHAWMPTASAARTIATLLPRTPLEIALWAALSVSGGVAEEIVFRGYFQRQLGAWSGSAWTGVALQAVLFGVSHGYQGVDACARITVIGAIFGALALWRRSLRPAMLAHVWTDVAAGIFRV